MTLDDILAHGIEPALGLLPARMDSPQARVQMLATGLQESRFEHRRQMGNGPARGFYQFEEGGGVKGVMTHPATRDHALRICQARGVPFTTKGVWTAIEFDDVLASVFARLLLWADPKPLPRTDDTQGGWECYVRNWRPGKPHPETWPAYHRAARSALNLL